MFCCNVLFYIQCAFYESLMADLLFMNDIVFQNALLPAGFRQRDQTKKAPTGTFQRDNLLAHLEKQAKEHPDRDDLVPYTGEKRGKK